MSKLTFFSNYAIAFSLLPPDWQQKGGESFESAANIHHLCRGKYSRILYLQMVGQRQKIATSLN